MKRTVQNLASISLLILGGLTAFSCSSDNDKEDNTNPPTKNDKKNHVSKVFEFAPSIGQFVNILPKYEKGDTEQTMRQKAEQALTKKAGDGIVSLGGFGGYVVLGMGETIENKAGLRDFRVLGNTFSAQGISSPTASVEGSSEPGIIMVAYDANKNGKPDEEEWYEIAGSEYYKEATTKEYEITYFRPDDAKEQQTGFIEDYLYWEDNQGNSGYKLKSAFHSQSYFPQWNTKETITFKGTLLASNAIDVNNDGSYWTMFSYDYGYADNAPNNHDQSSIDIDWAVDKQGNKIKLPGVDFIKIYTGVNQEVGSIGELSTEVMGVQNLHLLQVEIQSK